MRTEEFYQLLDGELEALVEDLKDSTAMQRQATRPDLQKSYALLVWFLGFYGKRFSVNYQQFVTDGSNDYSCDVVLTNVDRDGNKRFYVIQSKWNNAKNAKKKVSSKEIKTAIADFNTLLEFDFEQLNPNKELLPKLKALKTHMDKNGELNFIFLSLASYDGGADEHIKAFEKQDENIKFRVIDIDTIKSDYIDRYYKGITPINPIEKQEDPGQLTVELELAQEVGNFITIDKPFKAYIVLLRPKAIHQLFARFQFLLFQKNVRNPLLQSRYNEQIQQTAQQNPAYFWYYNNGLTGIAKNLPPLGRQAKFIEVTGFQIINGAQTVYSIYRAYEEASTVERSIMDEDTLITLRLLRSGGKDFDLNVTRYTNAQNPVSARSFHANDPVQLRLQEESYNTPYWYEKRDGEFRDVPEGITVVPNTDFVAPYLAFYQDENRSIADRNIILNKTNKDIYFLTSEEKEEGLYNKIFTQKLKFEELLTAYLFTAIARDIKGFGRRRFNRLFTYRAIYQKYKNDKHQTDNASILLYPPISPQEKLTIAKIIVYVNEALTTSGAPLANPTSDQLDTIRQLSITAAEIDAIQLPEDA